MGPFNLLRRRMTFKNKKDCELSGTNIPDFIGHGVHKDSGTSVIADAQAPSRKDSLASSAPAGTDCPECAAWVEHDYYRVTAGQLTIQELVFDAYQTSYDDPKATKAAKKSERYIQAVIRMCDGSVLAATECERLHKDAEQYRFTFNACLSVTPSTKGTIELFLITPDHKARSKISLVSQAHNLQRSMSSKSNASHTSAAAARRGSRDSLASHAGRSAANAVGGSTSMSRVHTLRSVLENESASALLPSVLLGTARFRVQDLPRDQGQGVGSKQLVLTFNGSLAEEKADKRGSVGGNNLCVMNKFTMMAGVTTKLRETIAEGLMNMNIQPANSVGHWHFRHCVLDGIKLKCYPEDRRNVVSKELNVRDIVDGSLRKAGHVCLEPNSLTFDLRNGDRCLMKFANTIDVHKWEVAFTEAVNVDNAWGMD